MKISKSFDVVSQEAPACAKGTNPFDNPGIMPSESAIKKTPGETVRNSTAARRMDKGQPFGKVGSGI